MNIFDIYLEKINNLLIQLNKDSLIELPKELKGINVDIPPVELDFDISTNVAMVLSKPNKQKPEEIAIQLSDYIMNNDDNIENISIAKPGFINIKFK